MAGTSDAQKVLDRWIQKFKQATDFDSWGQLVEAADEYSWLSRAMNSTTDNSGAFSTGQMNVIRKISFCLDTRAKFLQSMQTPSATEMPLPDVKQLSDVLKNLLAADTPNIPEKIETKIMQIKNQRDAVARHTSTLPPEGAAATDPSEAAGEHSTKLNSLLPRLIAGRNETLVTVTIDKIGLKKAGSLIDPHIAVLCVDGNGVELCPTQSTSNAYNKDDTYLYFRADVELQTPIERMPRGSAVYFELKHYKPAKRMTSLKCYAFMDLDELKSGPCVIELYKKPISYGKRNKLPLLTSKPLYLHLNLTLHTG